MSTSILMFEPSLLMFPSFLAFCALVVIVVVVDVSFIPSFFPFCALVCPFGGYAHDLISLLIRILPAHGEEKPFFIHTLCQLPFSMTVHGSVCGQDLPRWICFGNLLCFMWWHMILFAKLRARSHLKFVLLVNFLVWLTCIVMSVIKSNLSH